MQKISILNAQNKVKSKVLKKIGKQKLYFIRNIIILFSIIFVVNSIINTIVSITLLQTPKNINKQPLSYNIAQDSSSLPYTQVRKYVISRNIFNVTGAIPPEDSDEYAAGLIKNFDKVPCSDSEGKLPFDLIGILYTGNPKTNLVTFKDQRVETADVYKEGQTIIEYDTYEVYKITSPSTVQLREQNKKICLATGTQGKAVATKNQSENNSQSNEQSYDLDSDYVSEQIGPGFSKILNSARLIPETSGGKTIGFKIYGITSGSLFDKINLENGDVITGVNGIDLEDPSQGFKIYEALQDETNITLQIKRAGGQMTKKVTVR